MTERRTNEYEARIRREIAKLTEVARSTKMTDPKTDRMLTDEELRGLLSETLFNLYDHGTLPNALREADAILEALTASGRLIPGGAEVQWAVMEEAHTQGAPNEGVARQWAEVSGDVATRIVTPWKREVQTS